MKKRHALIVVAVTVASFVLPGATVRAQECQPDDTSTSCKAQQTCEKLARKTQLVSCTQ